MANNQLPKIYLLDENTVNVILTFLGRQPWGSVDPIIQRVRNLILEIPPQLVPKPVMEEYTKRLLGAQDSKLQEAKPEAGEKDSANAG